MINKITIKKSVKIINNEYVIKKKNNDINTIYNYLESRNFNYFPRIIKEDNNYIYYEYINDIKEAKEQKITDLMILLAILHGKTTYYQEIDIDKYKYIYESINNKIDNIYSYYNNLMDNIDSYVYMSPSNYLIARNISAIYNSLNYAKENIDEWYKLVENKRKIRIVTLHNNLKLEHYLKSDKPYIISWDNSKEDMPIYDLISIYKNNYLDYEFIDLFNIYLSKYPLNDDEMILFLTIIAIPDKININESEYKTVLNIRRVIDYVYKTKEILIKYRVKKETEKT